MDIFDFSNLESLTIQEGEVAEISVGGVVLWQAESEDEQLTVPTIVLNGDTLAITATDDRTEEFVILVDGEEKATAGALMSFTIDGKSYTSFVGMTWGEWVESKYNTGEFYIGAAHGIKNAVLTAGTTGGVKYVTRHDKNTNGFYNQSSYMVIGDGVAYELLDLQVN